MMYITDYDIILNLFLCVIDMFVITELRERIYGRIAHFRRLCLALSIALSSATAASTAVPFSSCQSVCSCCPFIRKI